jgi:hypothetical protein
VLPKSGNKVASKFDNVPDAPAKPRSKPDAHSIPDIPWREEAHNEIGAGSDLFKKSS